MIKKNVRCVGIEVRHSRDPQTKVETDKYYFHGICHSGFELVSGSATVFSAKIPNEIATRCEEDVYYDVVYRSYNGWLTVEDIYRV